MSGCRPSGGGEEAGSDVERAADARCDPLDLPQDKMIVPEEYPQTGSVGGVFVPSDPQAEDTLVAPVDVPEAVDTANAQTYRIQIYTGKLFGDAQRARLVAEEIFDRPCYLDYEVPYFKLRVGSFDDRDEAEEYQQRAKAAGYTNAWVVMVNVGVEELAPLYDTLLVPDSLGAVDSHLEGLEDRVGPSEDE